MKPISRITDALMTVLAEALYLLHIHQSSHEGRGTSADPQLPIVQRLLNHSATKSWEAARSIQARTKLLPYHPHAQ